MNPEQMTSWLKDFVLKYDLTNRATKNCWKAIHELLEENGSDAEMMKAWGVERFEIHLDRNSLVFEHDWYETPWVDTKVGIYVRDDDSCWLRGLIPLGYYSLETTLDGVVRDDWFVLKPLYDPTEE
jgi:hypothetical protein